MASAGQPLPAPDPSAFFSCPGNSRQRRYEILRAFYFERLPAKDVAARFGCSASAVYAITRDFRKLKDPSAYFFRGPAPPGRPRSIPADDEALLADHQSACAPIPQLVLFMKIVIGDNYRYYP